MIDKTIDEIRDMVGAVSPTDTYTSPKIKLIKNMEKCKFIFKEDEKDLTKSKVPENINVLYDGKSKLIELILPETDVLEKFLNQEFKDKKYKTAIERKRDIRKELYKYIFGKDGISESVKNDIEKMYVINIKSVLTKGKKRLRNLAIKEIENQNPKFFENERILRHGHIIYVQPLESIGRLANIYENIREVMAGIVDANYDKDFLKEARALRDTFEVQIKRPNYDYQKQRQEIHSHMPETMKTEIEQKIEQMKQWEQSQMPEILQAKDHNLEILEELKYKMKELRRTYVPLRSFKIIPNQMEKRKIEIKDKSEIHKILNARYEWDGERDNIAINYQGSFKYKEYDVCAGYNESFGKVHKKTAKIILHHNLYLNNRWRGSSKIHIFIDRIENEQNRKYEIWLADGIWGEMDEEDFEQMKPYFDEDMKLLKEIKTGE